MATGQRPTSVYCGEEGGVGAVNSLICAMQPEFAAGRHLTNAGPVRLEAVRAGRRMPSLPRMSEPIDQAAGTRYDGLGCGRPGHGGHRGGAARREHHRFDKLIHSVSHQFPIFLGQNMWKS